MPSSLHFEDQDDVRIFAILQHGLGKAAEKMPALPACMTCRLSAQEKHCKLCTTLDYALLKKQ